MIEFSLIRVQKHVILLFQVWPQTSGSIRVPWQLANVKLQSESNLISLMFLIQGEMVHGLGEHCVMRT